ncbi:hypothetical protein GIB67_037999, partial [Kingdonia uniflora]
DLTMSSAEEEYDGTEDELEFESDEDEGYVSQIRFLSGKKRKITYEELNVFTKPHSPLPPNYEPRDFWRLTQSDGKGHLSTSVATTSARVGFKCRSMLVKLREMYLILIEGIVVDWEDDEGEEGTSQVGTSRGRGSRGRRSWEGNLKAVLDVLIESSSNEEEDVDESSTDYYDDDVIDAIKMEILSNQAKIDELQEAESS